MSDLTTVTTPNPAGFRDLTVERAPAVLTKVRIIDVRQPDEFDGELGHVPGAELVPLATVPAHAVGWDKAVPLLVVCRSGGRSSMASQALVGLGFREVYNLAGGMLAWNARGLPTA